MEDRININKEDFKISKKVEGMHSMTVSESQTKTRLLEYEIKKVVTKQKLDLKNTVYNKYFLVENGMVIKYDMKNYLFYKLDLDKYVWQLDNDVMKDIVNKSLKYQEFIDFKDYYYNSEELDLNKGEKKL